MDPSAELAASLSGEHIAKVLRTSGPTVKCVLLRCSPAAGASAAASSQARHDAKPSTQDSDENNGDENENTSNSKIVLTDLIEEIMVDTTPKKQMVAQVIGGPFTFLGQYEDEGIVVIVRRPEDMEGSDEDGDGDGEGSDVLVNPHELQPPLHNLEVRGDILLMRVAATEEEDEEEEELQEEEEEQDNDVGKKASDDGADDGETDAKEDDGGNEAEAESEDESSPGGDEEGAAKAIAGKIMSNEEFFLDYTKEEYIKFASRTDIIPQEEPEEEEEDNANENDDDEEEDADEEYNVESDSDEMEDDEECQIGMMNLILAQILKRFREENGRGPNTAELLAMRSALAEKLGIDESIINQTEAVDGDGNDNKRRADTSEDASQREKRVKFTNKDEIKIMTDDERTDNEATTE